jgi:DNA methylase
VLDPYAGSGTTLSVAAKMGRAFLGIDASEVAIETMAARLSHLFAGADLEADRSATHDAMTREAVGQSTRSGAAIEGTGDSKKGRAITKRRSSR